MSQLNNNTDSNQDSQESTNSKTTQWVDLIGALFDRLTGKEAIITYEFDNLIIDIPKAAGPGGKDLGSAKWTINGKLIIKAEAISK
ncbi:MAG: hypothetical protein ACM3VV_00925 [Deltaproteobacteria bacterium]|jgi:hypothetical protein|nr:hypothetical protein [Nitrososphaeraceae archaeon]